MSNKTIFSGSLVSKSFLKSGLIFAGAHRCGKRTIIEAMKDENNNLSIKDYYYTRALLAKMRKKRAK